MPEIWGQKQARKALLFSANIWVRPAVLSLRWVDLYKSAVWQAIQARRLFVLVPFAMILGLICYAAMPFEPNGWLLTIFALGILAWLALMRHWPHLPWLGLVVAGWIGFILLSVHGHFWGTAMLARPAHGHFEARVDAILSATPETRRIIVSQLLPIENARSLPIMRARLVVPPEPVLEPGDRIRANIRLTPVPGPILPGAFDGQFHAYFSGVGAYGAVTSGFERLEGEAGFDFSRNVEGLRMAISARIGTVLEGQAAAAVGAAMVVGDQSEIDDETRRFMAASGLAHVYSISGLHLSIVAGGVYFLLRLLLAAIPPVATRWPIKKISALVGIVAAMAYLLLAGGLENVPALRSTLMLALVFGAVLAGRRALTMRNVAFSALAIIVIDPASVFRASFQLSYAAVVALIGIYEMPRRRQERDRSWPGKVWSNVWGAALTSFIAGFATLLFSAYHFQQTAPLGVLGNVLSLPLVSLVIMPFAVLSVLAMPFGVEAVFILVMGWGIERMLDVARLVAGWSEGWIGNPLLTGTGLFIGFLALAWFAFFCNWWRMAGPLLAVPAVLLLGGEPRPDILIADTTQAVAIRDGTGMALVTGRIGSFATEVWGQHYQEVIGPRFAGMRCDDLGCIATTPDFTVAIVRNAAAFAEDCAANDLVITRLRAPDNCAEATVIDATDLARHGVHWLKWDEARRKFYVRTAMPVLDRPWRILGR